jgi:hypothetical protein
MCEAFVRDRLHAASTAADGLWRARARVGVDLSQAGFTAGDHRAAIQGLGGKMNGAGGVL